MNFLNQFQSIKFFDDHGLLLEEILHFHPIDCFCHYFLNYFLLQVLIDMIIKTKVYLHTQECKRNLDKLVRHFRHLAEVSRGLNLNK